MYTRSRQSQNFNSGGPQRNQSGGSNQYQGQLNTYNNHGNYQGGNMNQQPAYKQQGGTPYKQPQQQMRQQQSQQQQQQSQQAQIPQAQRLKPILKGITSNNSQQSSQLGQNEVLNENQPNLENQSNMLQKQSNNGVEAGDNPPESMDSEVTQDIPKWKRKASGVKVNKKLKRLRLNQRLRKTLQPKNAIMVLNEMKTGVHFTFPEQQASLTNSLFLVHAEIEGKTYVGQGISKPLARQNAAENALKSLLLEKMSAAAIKARTEAENDGTTCSQLGEDLENKDSESNTVDAYTEDPNEIPWSSLASFALYKLFLDWQNQGTVVPVPRPGICPTKLKKDVNKLQTPRELPPNPLTIHPVMLLNQMKPGLIYTEVSRIGNPPNITFTLGVEIDGQEYTGTAKNKKDAKKLAARAALKAIYNLVYPEENQSNEDVNMA